MSNQKNATSSSLPNKELCQKPTLSKPMAGIQVCLDCSAIVAEGYTEHDCNAIRPYMMYASQDTVKELSK